MFKHSRSAAKRSRAVIETIERRLMMDAVLMPNGALVVTGTAGADVISVDNTTTAPAGTWQATVNGVTQTFAAGAVTAVTVSALAGSDAISLTAAAAAVPISINGGDDNDTITVVVDAATTATISGGAGVDTADFSAMSVPLVAYLDGSRPSGVASHPAVTFDGTIENFLGGTGNDYVVGTAASNSLSGNGGNDTLVGGGGADSLYGGAGNDLLDARGGTADFIDGGPDSDIAFTGTNDTGANIESANPGSSRLTGSPIGTSGSYNGQGNTIAKAFDNTVSTFFDGPTPNGNTAGLDLGASHTITSLSFAPRTAYASRMVGGIFQAANSADFSDATTIYTITTAPVSGSLTTVNVAATQPSRYVRYVAPAGSYGNIAEFAPFGLTSATTPGPIPGTISGTAGSYQNDGNTIAKAFDGSPTTFFDGPTANGDVIVDDFGTPYSLSTITFAPRANFNSRMVGGVFQGSNDSTFAAPITLYTITTAPSAGLYTSVVPATTAPFRYVRYVAPAGSYGNVAEIAFVGSQSAGLTKFTGAVIGTPGSYNNTANTIAKAFDGNLTTFFDGPTANGNWVGLDLGSTAVAAQVKFAPRNGYESRMIGGQIQASTTADFSAGVVTLATITTQPPSGSLTTLSLNNTTAYRYYRYLSPTGSYGNIAELEFDG